MFVEGLRADSLWLIKPSAAGLADGVRVSQLLSAVLLVLAAAFLIIRALREKKLGRLIWPSPRELPAEVPEADEKAQHTEAPASDEADDITRSEPEDEAGADETDEKDDGADPEEGPAEDKKED